ncbi:MAG: dephospho-CoA kinase [Bacteroidaceae bacterium]|nr:dephospho-CoA kinase [Bacteroidaceae bacterium]
MTTTALNKAQIEVLNALSHLTTAEDVLMLKQAIAEFFAKRADAEMEKLWEQGAWNENTLQDFSTAHYRTPY